MQEEFAIKKADDEIGKVVLKNYKSQDKKYSFGISEYYKEGKLIQSQENILAEISIPILRKFYGDDVSIKEGSWRIN